MITIRDACPDDLAAIAALLERDGLLSDGVLAAGTRFWVAMEGERLVGAIGLELGSASVLLRSAIVEHSHRGRGLGRELVDRSLGWARSAGFTRVFCFSTDAGSYWLARGFVECPVSELVAELPDAPQVRQFERLGWLPTEVAYTVNLV